MATLIDIDKIIASSSLQLDTVTFVERMWCAAIHMNLSIALFREPFTTNWQVIIDFSDTVQHVHADLEELPMGFLVHAFEKTTTSTAYFIEGQLYFDTATNKLVENLSPKDKTTYQAKLQEFVARIQTSIVCTTPYHISPIVPKATSQLEHGQAVEKAIEAMQIGLFEKVVISRNKFIQLPTDFDVLKAFQKLDKTYPSAYISLFSIPTVGTWLAATPELLVSQNAQGIFRTMALAGTQAAVQVSELKDTLWRQKEIEEQALVSRYIINCFKKIRLREFDEIGPKTVKAGNLLHLRTEFVVDTVKERFPQLATVMLDLLHPTSAVCGMPKDITTQFILDNEGYDRQFYAGYLGAIHLPHGSNLYVHLRCMQLLENQAVLYAGGGITADSDIEREWHETELKTQTLGNVIF